MSSDFNLQLLNITIGMANGDSMLDPWSASLSGPLDYRLRAVEYEFPVAAASRNVRPECMLSSGKSGHTLLTEWTTQTKLGPRKCAQLAAYGAAVGSDITVPSIPAAERADCSTWVVVPKALSGLYSAHIRKAGLDSSMMLSTMEDASDGFIFEHAAGTLRDTDAATLLASTTTFARLPLGYVRIDTDSFDIAEFLEFVAGSLVSFAVSQRLTFGIEDVCHYLFPGYWSMLGEDKKVGVRRYTKTSIDHIRVHRGLKKFIQPSGGDYALVLPAGRAYLSGVNSLQKSVAKFVGEVSQPGYNLPIT